MNRARINRRIAREIQKKIATLIKSELDDPIFDWVAIEDVILTPDRKTAYIIFDVFGEMKTVHEAQRALQKNARFLAELLGRSLHLRYTPKFVFLYEHDPDTLNIRLKYGSP